MKIAMITTIENSETNLGPGAKSAEAEPHERSPLEEDAIECFKSWKNYNKLNIEIFCICPTKRIPKKSTIEKIKSLGVNYLEQYLPETEDFICGYWNVISVGKWCEKNLTEFDYFIHTDLDMQLIKSPSIDFFLTDKGNVAKIGTLDNGTFWRRSLGKEFPINFETCFINSWRENRFYHIWWNELQAYLYKNYRFVNHYEIKNFDEIEEYIIDILYSEKKYKIEPIANYQMGFWYPIEDKSDEEIKKIHFLHSHSYEERDKTFLRYIKRLKNANSTRDNC